MMAEFNAIDNYPFDKVIGKKNLILFLKNSELGELWTIHLENKTIGYIVLTFGFGFGFSFEYGGRDAFIDEFFIKEGFRNQGIGKTTIELLEVQARKLGVIAIHLDVDKDSRRENDCTIIKAIKAITEHF